MQKLFKTRKTRLHEDVELSAEEKCQKEQIKKNMHDYQFVRNIGDPKDFNKDNFLDENYQMFLDYINDFLNKQKGCELQNFDAYITPEDLKFLNGKPAYKKVIIKEDEYGTTYAVKRTHFFNSIVKTRALPNRERVLKMLLTDSRTWDFHHLAYTDEYINDFEKYFKLLKHHWDSCSETCPEVLQFHPMFFELLCVNFDVYFSVTSISFSEDSESFLELTTAGRNLLRLSDKISKKLGERKPLHYYM